MSGFQFPPPPPPPPTETPSSHQVSGTDRGSYGGGRERGRGGNNGASRTGYGGNSQQTYPGQSNRTDNSRPYQSHQQNYAPGPSNNFQSNYGNSGSNRGHHGPFATAQGNRDSFNQHRSYAHGQGSLPVPPGVVPYYSATQDATACHKRKAEVLQGPQYEDQKKRAKTREPAPPTAPAVPSFTTSLPTNPSLPAKPRNTGALPVSNVSEKWRPTKRLGLVSNGDALQYSRSESDEDEDADADEDEEAALLASVGGNIAFIEHNGEVMHIKTASDVALYMVERRKRFPTQAQIAVNNENKRRAQGLRLELITDARTKLFSATSIKPEKHEVQAIVTPTLLRDIMNELAEASAEMAALNAQKKTLALKITDLEAKVAGAKARGVRPHGKGKTSAVPTNESNYDKPDPKDATTAVKLQSLRPEPISAEVDSLAEGIDTSQSALLPDPEAKDSDPVGDTTAGVETSSLQVLPIEHDPIEANGPRKTSQISPNGMAELDHSETQDGALSGGADSGYLHTEAGRDPDTISISSESSVVSPDSEDDDPPEQASSRDPPKEVTQRPKKPCVHFARDHCRHGERCGYSHERPPRAPVQQQPQRSQPRKVDDRIAAPYKGTMHSVLVQREQEEETKLALKAIKHLGQIGFFSRLLKEESSGRD